MIYRVGQRVRLISIAPNSMLAKNFPYLVGREGVVGQTECIEEWHDYGVDMDGFHARIYVAAHRLAPLLDPRCSEFVADMNRFSVAAKKQVELSPEQMERVQGGSYMYLTRPDGFYLVTSSGARRISK